MRGSVSAMPPGLKDGGIKMSNFDCSIDADAESLLKARGHFIGHAARNFFARVWWNEVMGKFESEVWIYGSPVAQCASPTLQELMEAHNNEFGWE